MFDSSRLTASHEFNTGSCRYNLRIFSKNKLAGIEDDVFISSILTGQLKIGAWQSLTILVCFNNIYGSSILVFDQVEESTKSELDAWHTDIIIFLIYSIPCISKSCLRRNCIVQESAFVCNLKVDVDPAVGYRNCLSA